MSTWTLFANLTSASTVELDTNYATLAAQSFEPCSVTGTNALVMIPLTNAPPVSVYQNYMAFFGVAAAANTGVMTASVGSLPALPVFVDTASGPAAVPSATLQPGNALTLTYDSSLGAGGGFHLDTGPQAFVGLFLPLAGGTMTGGVAGMASLTMAGAISGVSTITTAGVGVGNGPIVTRVLSTLASIAFTSIAPGGSQIQPVSLTGVQVRDNIMVGLPSPPQAGVVFDGYVSVANVALIRATNATAASILPFGATYRATGLGFT